MTNFSHTNHSVIKTLVIVDPHVEDYQSLVNAVVPTAQVILLNPTQDGVSQITAALQTITELHSLQIISHGSPGCLYLGNSQLSLDTLDNYGSQLQTWFKVHNLLLYGCNVAAGDAGAEFIQRLKQITGAEIAASANPTGSKALGGDWDLEVTTDHQFTVELALSRQIQETYGSIFAPPANDNLANLIDLGSDISITTVGTNVEATGEDGEEPILSDSTINSVWWSWTAPVEGILTIDTFGSGITDTLLAVYRSTTFDNLSPVEFNDNASGVTNPLEAFQSELTIDVTEGTEYIIAVDGFDEEVGDIALNLDFQEFEPPTISGLSDITATNDFGLASANVTISIPIIDDNVEVESVVNDFNGTDNASGVYSLGVTTVTYTVTDTSGNVTEESFTVTVSDAQAPTVIANNITVELDETGIVTITPEEIDNGSFDNSNEPISLSLDIDEFDANDVGNNTVVLTVTDSSGNESTANATVTVEDNLDPIVITQDIELILDDYGDGSITVDDINNGSSDNTGMFDLSLDVTDFTISDVGEQTVTLTAIDESSNTSTATATVTVIDNIAPEIVVIPDFIVELDESGIGTLEVADIDDGIDDAAEIDSIELSQTTFGVEDIGVQEIEIVVTDVNENVATETFTVTVEDNIAPEAIGQDLTIQLDAQGFATITPEEIDNGSTDATGIASLELSQMEFTGDDLGDNTVTLTVTDNNGNISTDDVTVTVEDEIAPEIITPNDITIGTDAGETTATVDIPELLAIDNVEIATIVNDFNNTDDPSDIYPLGETEVIYTVTDTSGNFDSVSFTVTVIDEEAPDIYIVSDIEVSNDPGEQGADIDIPVPMVTDNDTVVEIVNDFNDTQDASGFYPLGTTTVTYSATDSSGNVTEVSFDVTVIDDEAPVISPLENIIVENEPGFAAAEVTIDIPTVTDNSAVVSLVNDFNDTDDASGIYPLGATNVTYTATDDNGNVTIEVFRVLVTDVEAPNLIGVPEDTTAPYGSDIPEAFVIAEDNSGSVELDFEEILEGDLLHRTWTATDGAGNVTSETQEIKFFKPIEVGNNFEETISASDDDNFIWGLDGNDDIEGNQGNDVIFGGSGDDVADGGAGNDVIYAGQNWDVMTGGADADIFVLSRDLFSDTITDFTPGEDKIALTNGLRLSRLELIETDADTEIVLAHNGRIITTVSGVIGLDETDFIDASGGEMGGNQFIVGDETNEIIVAGDGNDAIRGRQGNDTISGGAGIDIVLGHEGDDQLFGEEGNDFLRGGQGFDILEGGLESDIFVLEFTSGSDTIVDFEVGIDLFGVAGINVGSLSIAEDGDDLNIFSSNQLLATVLNVEASQLSAEDFIII